MFMVQVSNLSRQPSVPHTAFPGHPFATQTNGLLNAHVLAILNQLGYHMGHQNIINNVIFIGVCIHVEMGFPLEKAEKVLQVLPRSIGELWIGGGGGGGGAGGGGG